jgi:magnesium transporter
MYRLRWSTRVSAEAWIRRKSTSNAVDFGLSQMPPRENSALNIRVLTWKNGMEWVDISGAIEPRATSTDVTLEERRRRISKWQVDVERFRSELEPELVKLGISSTTATRASAAQSGRGIVSIEVKKGTQPAKLFTPPKRSGRQPRLAPGRACGRFTRQALRRPALQGSASNVPIQSKTTFGLRAPSTSVGDDLFVEQGALAATTNGPCCPLPTLGSMNRVVTTELAAVCARCRYSRNDDQSGARAASKEIDVARSSRPSAPRHRGFRGTLREARGGIARSMRSIATNLYRDGSPLESIEDITHRITLFVLPDRLVTVHIHDVNFISKLRSEWDEWYRHSGPLHLVNAIVKCCGRSFKEASAAEAVLIDRLENMLYRSSSKEYDHCLRLLYAVSRRASIHTRVLAPMPATHRALTQALGIPDSQPHVRDVQTTLLMSRVLAQDVRDSTQGLLSLHFQRSASELEAMMRVLTIFSAIFIPLEFVTSLFGMNYADLPWLHESVGPLKAAVVMCGATAVTAAWFRLRRFV